METTREGVVLRLRHRNRIFQILAFDSRLHYVCASAEFWNQLV
jgi:hypothetical protein